ncbi:hypothetical protein [Isachenkonia alkalipeptolytica]|uniref:Uncharacterized protein n=1 Tax=Isachenkonia alkalipeptolytica TaxID=2565777 RepID=A0AA44BDM0_9CLOT|nr:hypothetical protein [Isachenkonia alkalipeptolytica]NBG88107.1 hypothetical protein [Isachenkonia alkalipeptolytica]
MKLRNLSNQTLAHGVLKELNHQGKHFTSRPWNYRRPDTTLWWLVPSTDWPAYPYGKYRISKEPQHASIGFWVEKGIKGSVLTMLKPKTVNLLKIDDHWRWHHVMEELINGKFEKRLLEVRNQTKLPVYIQLSAHYVTGDFEPYAKKVRHEEGHRVKYLLKSEQEVEAQELKGSIFKGFDKTTNLEELGEKIKQLPDLDWYWIDFEVYVQVPLVYLKTVDQTEHNDLIDFEEIVEKVFEPFMGLVKEK